MDEAPACVIRGFCLSSRLALSALIRDLCSTPGTRGRTSNRNCDASIKFVLNSSTFVLYHSVISVINNKRAGDSAASPFRRLALLSPHPRFAIGQPSPARQDE